MKKQVSKMNDKELDDFFKKLSSSPEIPFVPKDWDDFKKLLPPKKGIPPINGSKWILLLSLGIVGFILTLWITVSTLQNHEKIDTSPRITTSSAQITTEHNEQDIEKVADLSAPSYSAPKNNFKKSALAHSNKPILSGIENSSKNLTLNAKKITSFPVEWDPASKWTLFESYNQVFTPINYDINAKGDKLIHFTESASLSTTNNLAILVLASPDYSAIQFNHIPSSGINFGVNLEYFLKKNWSISTGIIHSQKTYSDGEGYWDGYNKAHQSLIGDCWIIEVPLNLRYYPIRKLKHKWFVSTGLSSYFMLKEKYALQYAYYNGKSYSESFEVEGSNQHVLGIWNIGFGYEQKLNKNFSVQAEPYFRVPLVGVGEGSLSLKSMGIFFGIKYYPFSPISRFNKQ